MGPMESLKSALCFTRGDMPKEEPMRKQALDLPEFLICRDENGETVYIPIA